MPKAFIRSALLTIGLFAGFAAQAGSKYWTPYSALEVKTMRADSGRCVFELGPSERLRICVGHKNQADYVEISTGFRDAGLMSSKQDKAELVAATQKILEHCGIEVRGQAALPELLGSVFGIYAATVPGLEQEGRRVFNESIAYFWNASSADVIGKTDMGDASTQCDGALTSSLKTKVKSSVSL